VEWKIVHIDETDSTNRWMKENGSGDMVVVADYQTAGRGCGTNRWESERGKNLLFSILLHPVDIPVSRQFHISMAISLAILDSLEQLIGDVSIKWPNDIYWRNGKLGGILIENRLQGGSIKDCIIGVGLNVNQEHFVSDAPNPVSLKQIHGEETERTQLLGDILARFEQYLLSDVKAPYLSRLYRRKGFHPYIDKSGAFMAELVDVEDDGHLILRDEAGRNRCYAFKEVSFVI
jgi:BirA family biotin operon repressor/biotin-[acetyl-CoA-carboxylase] ligase